jgi:ABC-2 type transport system ATP-binding protein
VPAIEVSGLVVRYGSLVAVDHLDLEADNGEVVALLGRNGAGKTSTVETLEGYRRRVAGSVQVLGLDPQRVDDHHRLTGRVGVMLQRGGIYPAMSPDEAVRLFAAYYEQAEDPGALLSRLGLTGAVARTPWRRLSGGEQQRLSLALALVGRPEVVFLDEPTAGVDPQGRVTIRAVIEELRAAGTCVVLTTHELDEAERLADRIVIIDKGRVVAAGTPTELTAPGVGTATSSGPGASQSGSGAHAHIRFAAPRGLDTAGLAQRLGSPVTEERPGEYRVDAPGLPATVATLTAWLAERDLPLGDLRAGRQRLEDVFLEVTSSESEEGDPGGDDGGGPAGEKSGPAGEKSGPAGGEPDPRRDGAARRPERPEHR